MCLGRCGGWLVGYMKMSFLDFHIQVKRFDVLSESESLNQLLETGRAAKTLALTAGPSL